MALHNAHGLPTDHYVTNDPLHQLFDAIDSISVQGYDEQRQVIYWNKGSEILYGYTKQEAMGKKLEDLIIPEPMQEPVIKAHSDWITLGIEIPAAELTLNHKDGSEIAVFSSHVMLTNQYNAKQMYCIDIDLSDVHKAQAEATLNATMLQTIFEAIPDLFFVLEHDGTITDYHASNKTDLYIPPEKFIGQKMVEVLPDKVADIFRIHIEKALTHNEMVSFEYELSMPDGTSYYEARMRLLPKKNQIMVIIRDITEPHRSAELIRRQAHFDSLTALPNRFLSLDRLSQMLGSVKKKHEKAAVFFLDLDNFKKVNDSLGHEVGDKLLIEAAHRLKHALKQDDTVGRLGGDEFIVLISNLNDESNAKAITERLLNAFREPFKLEGRELILTLSIGIAMSPKDGTSASELLRNADTAMYQAKALGRNTSSFFTQQMNTAMQRRFEIEEQMQNALTKNEFTVYYQPQIDVKTNTLIGAEALLRWQNNKLGAITPDEFIPIAEQTGLIIPIGEFVIKQALLFLKEWQASHKQKYTMAVNLSPCQFRDPELLNMILHSLNENNINHECLELEITEGVLMNEQDSIREALMQISKLGIKLSMDDFGTGYSSLSYLRQYSFDVLKIDRSFINAITDNKADCNLVKAAIAMSHSLEIKVVAEGVETKEQLDLLNTLYCDIAQGFYLSKPLPASQMLDFSLK
ncbi:EAL domain-containing protein [Pseudoalteromonas atlantica]|uniref:EAL domain-containing protein n=1 Tax=Pseudoalteromonas atlantica TaxID=288 RepID=UPI00373536BF